MSEPDYDPNLDWVPPPRSTATMSLVDDDGPDGLGRNSALPGRSCCGTQRRRAPRCCATIAPPSARARWARRRKPPRLAADEEPSRHRSRGARAPLSSKIEELADPARQLRTDEARRASLARRWRTRSSACSRRPTDDDDGHDAAPRRHDDDHSGALGRNLPKARQIVPRATGRRRLDRLSAATLAASGASTFPRPSKWRRSTSPSCRTRWCRNSPN